MDKRKKAECCTGLDSDAGCRNNYFDGKRLTTDSFRVEQHYFLQRRRVLNRALYGWGVVSGFEISVKGSRLEIGPGLALDECGRELLQSEKRQVVLDDLLDAAAKEVCERRGEERVCWQLSAHYAEVSDGPITVEDSCQCRHQEWERTCETVYYTLQQVPCADCCAADECELDCDCATGPCCDGSTREHRRGGCCLCQHVMKPRPRPESCSLTDVDDPCNHVCADLRNGVPIACLELERNDCRTTVRKLDACGPRRIVKSTDVLFDLIRGCDLTRISDIGWREWHRREEPVPFDDFSAALGEEGYRQHEYVSKLFWVAFSRPVRRDTVRADCFAITILNGEREGGWWQVLRVPILRVETEAGPHDPQDHISKATIVLDGAWVEDGCRGRRSLFLGSETHVEIEVRGDFIVDCNGQTVDANALGLSPAPTGNGTPGGTFVSTFRVDAAQPYAYANADRDKGASS